MFPDLFRDDVFTLETRRLFLRWPKAADLPALVTQAGDRRVAEPHAVIPHPYRPEHATHFIVDARSKNAEGQGLYLAIGKRSNPERLIGVVSLRIRPDQSVSIGYWVGVEHWGQGIATEAAQAIIDAAFLYTPVPALVAQVRVTNSASRTVLERCGFQYECGGMCARPAWGDSVPADNYRLNRALWASLKGWRAPVPGERPPLRESA